MNEQSPCSIHGSRYYHATVLVWTVSLEKCLAHSGAVLSDGGAVLSPLNPTASCACAHTARVKQNSWLALPNTKWPCSDSELQARCTGSLLQKSATGTDPDWDSRARAVRGSQLGHMSGSHWEMLPVVKQNVPEKFPKKAAEDWS